MEITYIYGNVLVDLPYAYGSLPHLQLTEMVGIFHKSKIPHKRKSCLIRLTIPTSFFSKTPFFTLFSTLKLFFFFSFPQTKKLNLKWLTTLQHSWTNWLAPTTWTLVNVMTDLNEFLGPKTFSNTWT